MLILHNFHSLETGWDDKFNNLICWLLFYVWLMFLVFIAVFINKLW